MIKQRGFIIAMALPLALVGCGKGSTGYQPTKAKTASNTTAEVDTSNLFPMTVGNQWTYEAEFSQSVNGQSSSGKVDITLKVTKVDKQGDVTTATVDLIQDGQKSQEQKWIIDKTGIYQVQVGAGKTVFSPKQPTIMFPASAGKNYTWKGTGMTPAGNPGNSNFKATILAPQDVDTAGGERLNSIPVMIEGSFTDNKKLKGTYTNMLYWAPKVGMARFRQEIQLSPTVASIQVLKLKAYVVK